MSKRLLAELQTRVNSQMMVIDALRIENQRLKDGSEVNDLRQRIRKLNEQLRFGPIPDHARTGYEERHSSGSIPKEMLRRLKQLAHPDKHGNSELSNTVMKFLNTI